MRLVTSDYGSIFDFSGRIASIFAFNAGGTVDF